MRGYGFVRTAGCAVFVRGSLLGASTCTLIPVRTYGLRSLRSLFVVRWFNLAHKTTKKPDIHVRLFRGTHGRIRTYDLWLRKPTLYPAELRARNASREYEKR